MKTIAFGVVTVALVGLGLGLGLGQVGGQAGGQAGGAGTQPGYSEAFLKLVPDPSAVKKLSGGHRFVEGPTWLAGQGLVFSDIPKWQQHLLVLDSNGGATTRPFREQSNNTNGTTLDREGRLLCCEQGNRRVVRLLGDGKVEVVADRFEGKRFNSTNDVVVARDGSVIFSDPTYGPAKKDELEIGFNGVYRASPSGEVTLLVKEMVQPNGVALSPDDSVLYVSDTGSRPSVIRAFPYKDGKVGEGRVFYTMPPGAGGSDGMRVDMEGNVWTSAGNEGARVISPKGELIGVIKLPEGAANVGFGGEKGTTLFITARTGVYAVETTAKACR